MKKNEKKKNNEKGHIIIYILLFVGLLLIYSRYIEPYNLTIREYKIENKDIPSNFDGLKIVHFSDVHYGMTVDYKYLKEIVNNINNQNPDIVIFTGDFIDKNTNLSDKEVKKINKLLSKINSTLGNYVVTGNHDYKHIKDFKNIFDGSFTILNNQEKLIYYKDSIPLSFVGLDDSLEGKIDYDILNDSNEYFRFVLVHEGDVYDKISDYKFNVMLSGHSHNGQVRLPIIGKVYTPVGAKKYYDYYYKFGDKELFISNGIGTSGVKFRNLSRPSINLYRLYSE